MGRRVGRWALALALAGCEARPPTPPSRDAGPRPPSDASTVSLDAAYVRPPGGPHLPDADAEVTLPYLGPEVRLTLTARAETGALDVFLSIDTTGSFGGEIDALQADLERRIVPSLAARVGDLAIGVGRFEDFPEAPFGSPSDRPFTLLTGVTTDLGRVRAAVGALDEPLGQGGDLPEAGAEALYQIATGEGYTRDAATIVEPAPRRAAPGGGTIGGVGFREGSLRAVVHVTDAPSHGPSDYGDAFPGTHTLADAAAALRAIDARTIGIASGPASRSQLVALATATGATVPPSPGGCPTRIGGAPRLPESGVCPLVFDVDEDGSGVSDALVDALEGLLDAVVWRDVHGEAVDDRLGFVRRIEATDARVPSGAPPSRADLHPLGDGVDDTFLDVRAGTEVDLVLVLGNEAVRPADYDQEFRVTVRLWGDDRVLRTSTVRVVVPRGRLLDAG